MILIDAAESSPGKPSSRRPGRPRGGKVLADRATLLCAAENVIRRSGPDVTMEAIAAEATVTKPILYRNIGDKDALVTALAERFVDRINEAGTVASSGATDARDGLRRVIGSLVDVVEADRNVFLFVTSVGSTNDPFGEALRLADRSAQPLAAQLAAQRLADGHDPAVALTWAYAIVGALHFATMWWLRNEPFEPTQLADHLTELLWSGLSGTRPRTAQRGTSPRRQQS